MYDSISSCIIGTISGINTNDSHFRIPLRIKNKNSNIDTAAMIDSGATARFMNKDFAKKHWIQTRPLKKPIEVFNIDGTPNQAGRIERFARLDVTIDGFKGSTDFLVTDLGEENLILGLPWLREVNADVNWEEGSLRLRKPPAVSIEDVPDNEPQAVNTGIPAGGAILEDLRATSNVSVYPDDILITSKPEPDLNTPPPDLPDLPQAETPEGPEPEEMPPPVRIRANRATRRKWVKQGILNEQTEEVWCAAGFTYAQQLAEAAHKDKPTRTFEEMVPEQYRNYAKVFSETESERLPARKPWDHAIELTPGAPNAIRTKVYAMSPTEQEELDRFLEDNLRKGYIRPSKSPIASPVFFVKKKDGKLRFVQDYRRLNEHTIKNRYPLPLVADIVSRLQGAKYFTKFDVRWGYNNIRIKEGDEWKAAFATNRGLFEPNVMFFGLTNSPATFQALMNSIFADLIATGKVAVYLDDILIFSMDLSEHRELTREVLARLEKNDLYLRPEKCEFEKESIEYLGLIVGGGEVKMDPVKVAAVRDWPAPTNLKELRAFLGFANFYRRFIKNFAKIARPLNDLTRKNTSFDWGTHQQAAFEELRSAFVAEPILTLWKQGRPTRIEVDASGFATGGALLQKLDDGQWHPVAFRSASMLPAERNYEIYDREMLAIIEALKDWRAFLEGADDAFDIVTDHENLQWWRSAQDLTRRQARWALYLSRFDFHLIHRPGRANTQADPLSRMPHHRVHDNEDNQQQTVLRPEHFVKIAANAFVNPLEERIRNASEREAEVLEGLKALEQGGLQRLAHGLPDWEEDNGLVYHKGRVYVPPDIDLRRAVLEQCHDSPTAGHGGIHSTYDLVSTHYWWPGMRAFVDQYVRGCDNCARKKHHRHPRAITVPLEVPAGLWETVGVDLITGLPESNGFDAILVCIDLYSKMIHAIPCNGTIDANGIADLYYREIFRLHGLPLNFVSDRGPQFAAALMQKLLTRLGIKSNMTSGYHPQANGQTERANQEVEKYLRLYISRRQNDWARHLPMAEFVINSRTAAAHGSSPFEVTYGYLPHFNIPIGTRTGVTDIDERIQLLEDVRKDVDAALQTTKRLQKERFERGKQQAHNFKEGDLVYLDSKDIQVLVPSRKLAPGYLGPYPITRKVGELDYVLSLHPSMRRIHNTFHVDKLYPCQGNEVNGEQPPEPGPVLLEPEDDTGEPEWEVEEVTDSRWSRGQLQYWVRWKGYGPEAEEWVWADDMESPDLIREFYILHPGAAGDPAGEGGGDEEIPISAERPRRSKRNRARSSGR
jgi:hypothetical protein